MSKPKLGFLGVGWIGRHRMEAMLATGDVEAVAISDPSPEMAAAAQALAPGAVVVDSLEAMLATGLVEVAAIADPSPEMAAEAGKLAAGAAVVDGLDATRDKPQGFVKALVTLA